MYTQITDPIHLAYKALNALYLEAPAEVVNDVKRLVNNAFAHYETQAEELRESNRRQGEEIERLRLENSFLNLRLEEEYLDNTPADALLDSGQFNSLHDIAKRTKEVREAIESQLQLLNKGNG